MNAYRVLIVEDNEGDAKLVGYELARAGVAVAFERVDSADALEDALRRERWDLVISDWAMPGLDARKAIAMCRELGRGTPVIVVSGTLGEDIAVEAMRAGASDFVLKDNLARLAPAVEREIREHLGRAAREEALRKSELRFTRLAESGIIGISVADLEGRIHYANDAHVAMLGYSREDMESGSFDWTAMVPPGWQDEPPFAELRATGLARPWEQELYRKDGSVVHVLMGVAMLDDTSIVSFLVDLSERKRAEAALRKSEEQLQHSQKMEAIGVLAGGVAHDFNNLLSVILAYTSMAIQEMAPEDPLREDLEEVKRAGERAAALTRQLLAFSRRQVVQPKIVSLDDILASMDKMLRRLIGEDVQLTLIPCENLRRVKVDPGHIEQVVMNLAVNARDAMAGGGHLTITTDNVVLGPAFCADHPELSPGPHVKLSVADTGSGMTRELLDRIFEPFFTTKEKGRGTGLGLSTVLGMVQQSGGGLTLTSEVGAGTTFDLYFPSVEGTAEEWTSDRPAPIHTGSETILLVEDDEPLRRILASILRKNGYQVLDAAGGGDAVLISEQHPGPIQLLLTDVVMPRMSGPQLAERIGRDRPDMSVLYMSGYTDDTVLRHGVLHDDIAFLEKPITPLALARKVRQVLDAARAPR